MSLAEEFTCAQFLDGLPEVNFRGRNLPRQEHVIPPANFQRLAQIELRGLAK